MRATNASSIAATLNASVRPSEAPRAAASMKFASTFSTFSFTEPRVGDSSVSGNITFAITSAAGADMTDAAIRWPATLPK